MLPAAFTDADRLARFEREARLLAALNHPHIAAIYGVEEAEGTRALILELVEGETLADRLERGPIPVAEALPIARQIAEALESAHELGIIHRDLKPANVKVRPDGMAKVLDFGLAKALDPAPSAVDASQSPAITSPAMTGMGVILGTAAYMSLEQARGKAVDRRTDIWALGAVLFEMLTGRRIYEGETLTDTLAQVITHLPRWDPDSRRYVPALPRIRASGVHPREHAVCRPLRRKASRGPRESAAGPVRRVVQRRRGIRRQRGEPDRLLLQRHGRLYRRFGPGAYSRLGIVDRSGTPLFTYPEKGEFGNPRFSPDGTRIALQMGDGKTNQLYVLNVDRQQMTKVTFDGTFNTLPVWSPDGQQLAYASDRVSGGVNVFLTRSDGASEPEALTTGDGITFPTSFSQDGRHLLVMQAEQGSSAANIGAASYNVGVLSLADRQVTPFAATPANELVPAFSPDGRWVAYHSFESGRLNVYVRPYPGPGGRWLISAGGRAQPYWTKGGRELVYLAIPTGLLLGPPDRFMAVDIAVEAGALRPGKPQVLFEMPLAHPPYSWWYDVSSDGSRFVVLKVDENVAFTHVTLVFNFFDEVRRVLAGR